MTQQQQTQEQIHIPQILFPLTAFFSIRCVFCLCFTSVLSPVESAFRTEMFTVD